MKTSEKILVTAQSLFNKEGLANVSVRDICESIGISVGNFTYHFPNRDQLMIQLYNHMIAKLEEAPKLVEAPQNSILFFLQYHHYIFKVQSKYKFFYLNTFELLKNHPEIKKAYLKHIKREKEFIEELMQRNIEAGVFEKTMTDDVAKKIIRVGQIVNIAWITDAEISFKGNQKSMLKHYLELCCSIIEPYLTPSAREEYEKFFLQLSM